MSKIIKQLYPVELPEDICWWFHPDLKYVDPLWGSESEDGYTDEQWQQLKEQGNIEITIDSSISIDDIEEVLGRETDGEWTGWKPNPPSHEHFLLAAYDTDNSECVLWWAKKKDNSEKIEQFIAEFKKTWVYDLLTQTLSEDAIFEHVFNPDGTIAWFKEQTRQMWAFWNHRK